MKQIRAYPLESQADLARLAFEGADIPAVVVGVGIGMKGGVLLVPEDRVEAALKVLKDFEIGGERPRTKRARQIEYRRSGPVAPARLRGRLARHRTFDSGCWSRPAPG
jgi:hypothetical protein